MEEPKNEKIVIFICPNTNSFLTNYKNCLKCKDEEVCINYQYELNYQKRKQKEKENG